MDISTELDSLRSDIPGCALAAFTDLNTRIVLSASAANSPAQEEMMALSRAAQLALDGGLAQSAAGVWGGEDSAEVAMLLTGADARVFMRSGANQNEALICVCAADADLDQAVMRARQTLERIAEGN